MIHIIQKVNMIAVAIFTLCYAYHIFYAFISCAKKSKPLSARRQCRYAVLIAARNEEAVISQLIDSIKQQDYPQELIDIYVIADNCTDNTAKNAFLAGANVTIRDNTSQVGKGYALAYLLDTMQQADKLQYDGYFIFDADNLLKPDYITQMNKVFTNGYQIVTGYRNSKNFDENWISAGYSLWFLRESKYLNQPRMQLGTSCAVSGTGFLFSHDILMRQGGWKHFLLTEDIEFTVDNILQGGVIGYCGEAMLYDEQPVTFSQSWKQRLRWAKGFYQVLRGYGKNLLASFFVKKSFACFDMIMSICPAALFSIFTLVFNLVCLGYLYISGSPVIFMQQCLFYFLRAFGQFYLVLLFSGGLTLLTEWKHIAGKPAKKLAYLFSFPIFMMTYVPIALAALFQKVEWSPIQHRVSKTIGEFQ